MKIRDDLGFALLIRPHEKVTVPSTMNPSGVSEAIRADWIVLDGPSQGQLRENSLVYGKVLVSELEAVINGPSTLLAGRLIKRPSKDPGKQAAYAFEDLDDATLALAQQAQTAFNW